MAALPTTTSMAFSPSASPSTKPSLPKRSHRRSLIGESRPPLSFVPPLPSTAALHGASSKMTSSSSMMTLPSTSSQEAAREKARVKRASTGATFSTGGGQVPYVAPLNIASKKGARPSTSDALASPSSPMSTPTMPAKSRYRKSVDSPGSIVGIPGTRAAHITSRAEFVKGIGLDSGSPDSEFLPYSALKRTAESGSPSTRSSITPLGDSNLTEDDHSVSETSPSSVATSIPDKDKYANSHDAVFSHPKRSLGETATTPKRKSLLLSSVPMGISRSHQDCIDGSPRMFHREEAEGLFDSVRGLMADLRIEVEQEEEQKEARKRDAVSVEQEAMEGEDVRSWLVDPKRSQAVGGQDGQVDLPSIKVAVIPTSSGENTADAALVSNKDEQREKLGLPEATAAESEGGGGGASPGVRGLWGLLRAPSSAAATRSPSVSSYSSTSSFIPRSTSPIAPNNASTSSLLSNSSFSLFSRKLITRSVSDTHTISTSSCTNDDDNIPLRLSRRQVDEDKLADLIISCADARHVLKTESSPTKLKQVGLKLELGWREQLAEAQQLRSRLEVTQDTVEDLEDENKQLRSQLGTLSEQVVSREDDMRVLEDATRQQLEREREKTELELELVKSDAKCTVKGLERVWQEEKAFALGLGLMLRQSGRVGTVHENMDGLEEDASLSVPGFAGRPPSILFDLAHDSDDPNFPTTPTTPSHLRRCAILQSFASDDEPPLDQAYEDLFRCPTHRFPVASPSTLVDERVLLVGTDQRLMQALAQKLVGLGLSQVVLAMAVWSEDGSIPSTSPARCRGVRSLTFDPSEQGAWRRLEDGVRRKMGGGERGGLDCVVYAFDRVDDVERLRDVVRLIEDQVRGVGAAGAGSDDDGIDGVVSTKQPMSVVNIVYDDSSKAPSSMAKLALIGLASDLCLQTTRTPRSNIRPVRLNTLLLPSSTFGIDNTIEATLRLMDPCTTVQGCILHPGETPERPPYCTGPPLCPTLPALYSSPNIASPSSPSPSPSLSRRPADKAKGAGERWLKIHKRIADVELLDKMEQENEALKENMLILQKKLLLLEKRQSYE
ncbi:uncharacterized protein UTRI_03498_B [Ustilago trichophora]|uniref:Uncharacterized protein n=1 Tax=Ustilago trichophora TaxID=86804 RepID=A0A5C3E0V9_9BASI|nr:uncharacterized protein UTRI_03498_B [Ustilago trichophora]